MTTPAPRPDAKADGKAAPADAAELSRRSDRIEGLLDELRAVASPAAWQKVEQLMQALVELYGAGLSRMLDLVGEGPGSLSPALAARLDADDLVAGLLALHGLHPLDAATRIRRALGEVSSDVSGEIDALELLSLDGGVARLRVAGGAALAARRAESLARALEQLVEAVAPEVTRVEIEGLARSSAGASVQPLVQIDLARSRASGSGVAQVAGRSERE